MSTYELPTVAVVKSVPLAEQAADVVTLFNTVLRDKRWHPGATAALTRAMGAAGERFGHMFQRCVTRNLAEDAALWTYAGRLAGRTAPLQFVDTYEATAEENQRIDSVLFHRGTTPSTTVPFFGVGLSDRFDWGLNVNLPAVVLQTKVAIIGAGPAGLMAAAGLKALGFSDLTVFDRQGHIYGIWGQENVYKGSRNNPRALTYLGHALPASPGDGTSVRAFIENLSSGVTVQKATVQEITPGCLQQVISFTNRASATFPIVINAAGTGKPRPLSHKRHMTTTNTSGGIRWQQILTEKDVRRKRLLFIGLGNSTAEMLRQMHAFQDKGIDTDYRVLTHYSDDVLHNPMAAVPSRGKAVKLFRDPVSNLVDYEGDLPLPRADYFRALRTRRIVSDVVAWRGQRDIDVTHRTRNTYTQRSDVSEVDQIYTLVGYATTREQYQQFGIPLTSTGEPLYDYDGEFRGDDRLGYFGFGAILETTWNPNATVIPGMLFRIGDLLMGVVMRAAQYQHEQGSL
jgi:hypothetical protein